MRASGRHGQLRLLNHSIVFGIEINPGLERRCLINVSEARTRYNGLPYDQTERVTCPLVLELLHIRHLTEL
jgi:hypothetical protein